MIIQDNPKNPMASKKKIDTVTEEVPNFEDPPGYVDVVTDEELIGDLLSGKPRESDILKNVIIIDGAPTVGIDRLEKLKSVINKLFVTCGQIVRAHYPIHDIVENGETKTVSKGYIFIEYDQPQAAIDAVMKFKNYKLDRGHTFLVNSFTDYETYTSVEDNWVPPKAQEYNEKQSLYDWLLDRNAFDQYFIHDTDMRVQIWQNSMPQPTQIENRERWTENFVKWSPLGTYIATVHKLGVALWGGSSFQRILRLNHQNVQMIDFSPMEQYIVTFSSQGYQKKIVIFDIRTGMEKRTFMVDAASAPSIRWSQDDKYFARIGPNVLSVYETPSFGLLDKKSISVNGIRDFEWSPSDNCLAYWVAEDKDVPARVVLLEIPSRLEIRSNNLFNVADCKIHWQKSGDFLCVKVDRYAKLRKENGVSKYIGMHYNFEIFHIREKNIPVDIIEIKESILAFAWEPVGTKFAIVHGEQNNVNVAFYNIRKGQKLKLTKLLEKKPCSHLFWSPGGQYIILADCREMGSLEFIDTSDFSSMGRGEHYKASVIEWDPTGRFVISAVSAWNNKADTGYWMWSFQGKLLRRYRSGTFGEFKWRPRPPSLLSDKKINDIKKNMKKYTIQFEQEDKLRLSKASKDVIEKRQRLVKEFKEYRAKKIDEWKKQKAQRMSLRNNTDTDDSEKTYSEETVEFLSKEEITIVET